MRRKKDEPALEEAEEMRDVDNVDDVDDVDDMDSPVYGSLPGEFSIAVTEPVDDDDDDDFGSSAWRKKYLEEDRNLTQTSISLLAEILTTNKKILDELLIIRNKLKNSN